MSKAKAPKNIKVDLPPAEAPAPQRTFEQIQNEFSIKCTKAGHLQYQITAFQADLAELNKQMRDLNLEAAALPQPAARASNE